MSFEIETAFEKGVAVVLVKGELVADSANKLCDHFDELVNKGHQDFVIDMQRLDFLDSTGLSSFVRLYKRLRSGNGNVQLCAMQEDVQRIFELTRLDKVFDIVADRQTAIDGLAHVS